MQAGTDRNTDRTAGQGIGQSIGQGIGQDTGQDAGQPALPGQAAQPAQPVQAAQAELAAQAAPFLRIQHVWKSYPDRQASGLFRPLMRPILQDVCLELRKGTVLGLLGESGSGKSTLARLLLGLEKPDQGSILLEGEAPSQWLSAHPGRCAVVFQDYATSLNPLSSVEQCLAEGLFAAGMRRAGLKKARAGKRSGEGSGEGAPARPAECPKARLGARLDDRLDDLLVQVGLSPSLRPRSVLELSGGQRQRVCLARALATDAQFIILDEAVSALDVSVQAEIVELLQTLRGERTWLFITHDVQLAALVCDSICVLHKGVLSPPVSASTMGTQAPPALKRLLASTLFFQSDFV